MKKLVPVGILLFSLAALLAAGTWTWFNFKADPAVNSFTADTVEIEINEHGFQDIENWNPGDNTVKQVSVKTLGSKCAYVRVSLTPVWGHMDGEIFVAEPSLPVDNVVFNWNQAGWVYDSGWYYCKDILCPEHEETSLLLESVSLLHAAGSEYQGKVLRIVVSAEAVQASHEAFKDAWGLTSLPASVEQWVAP